MACGGCRHKYPSTGTPQYRPVASVYGRYRPPGVRRPATPTPPPVETDSHVETETGTEEVLIIEKPKEGPK